MKIKPIEFKSKKAQMKIQETAFVLLALALLFTIVFVFYYRMQYSSIVKNAEKIKAERTISLLEKVAAMPEISCSSAIGSRTEGLCIDKDKLNALERTKGYEQMFKGIKSIEIVEIYPSEQTFDVYESSSKNNESTAYSTFASLCEQGTSGYGCSIAMVLVSM